jgi:hypothetical protein
MLALAFLPRGGKWKMVVLPYSEATWWRYHRIYNGALQESSYILVIIVWRVM